ncbi:hypothetical protein ACSC9U_18270 [Pseudomonas solani]|uniref:hypothetical protein n=1 Tax=Pseudomonas solani TaxID=2731552 RepID=UPI003F4AF483
MTGTTVTQSEQGQISVRVEWSRRDKVTLQFDTILTIMGVQHRTTEFIDRRALKAFKGLAGTIEERCRLFADQKTKAVSEALRTSLAMLVQSRHVKETN